MVLTQSDREAVLRQHYTNHQVEVSLPAQREFMLFVEGKGKVWKSRNIHYENIDEITEALIAKTPLAVYNSASLFLDPSYTDEKSRTVREAKSDEDSDRTGTQTEKKGWIGGELPFDIDFDHLPGWNNYREGIEIARQNAVRLVDDFLIGDFAFDIEDLDIRFSGHRGFHVLVTGEAYRFMTKEERRPLEDYILGTEVHASGFVFTSTLTPSRSSKREYEMYSNDAPGWGGRFTRTFTSMINQLRPLQNEEKRQLLDQWGPRTDAKANYTRPNWTSDTPQPLDDKTAKEIIAFINNTDALRMLKKTGKLSQAMWSSGASHKTVATLVHMCVQKCQLDHGAEIDRITNDIARQIRTPNSIHTAKFLPCVKITREDLEDFDLVLERISQLVGDEPTTISLDYDVLWEVNNEVFPAGEHTLPKWKAHSVLFGSKPVENSNELTTPVAE